MAREIGVRSLQQDASAVVSEVRAGEPVTITDRGRPVARLVPLASTSLARLIEAGEARPGRRSMSDLPSPVPGLDLSAVLQETRQAERY